MSYADAIAEEAAKARRILLTKGVEARYCRFEPHAEVVQGRIWAPAQAMTKFQMEQALGDWAEDTVRFAINAAGAGVKAIPFGDNDKTLSQEASFAELYRAGKMREMEFGKRADLLLFGEDFDPPAVATVLDGPEAEKLAANCIAALEVRSSRTSALKFIDYNKKQAAQGKKPTRMEPSFTVKVEDLGKVYRWIARNRKPLVYIQVFFDVIYALNFIDVFRYINACGKKLKLDNPARSGKYTIMIPISEGAQAGVTVPPAFEVVHTLHENGRHDIYAKPVGGSAKINMSRLLRVIS